LPGIALVIVHDAGAPLTAGGRNGKRRVATTKVSVAG
jgi:hypothetical protein